MDDKELRIVQMMQQNILKSRSVFECSYGYCKELIERIEAVENASKNREKYGKWLKQKEQSTMTKFKGTRAEAVDKYCEAHNWEKGEYNRNLSSKYIAGLEALGLIEFEEETPVKSLDTKIAECFHDAGIERTTLSSDALQ